MNNRSILIKRVLYFCVALSAAWMVALVAQGQKAQGRRTERVALRVIGMT